MPNGLSQAVALREGGAIHATNTVTSTAEYGVDPDWVEAMCFAWLAKCTLEGVAGNVPAVTGARHPVVLGGIYQSGLRQE